MKKMLPVFLFAITLCGPVAYAKESSGEKGEAMMNKGIDNVKKTWRNAKGEVCEMLNGKMSCLAEKVGDKMKNAGDSAGSKVKETTNKID